MVLKCQVASAFSTDHMHALLYSDYATLTYILHFFALCRRPKGGGGGGHVTMSPKTPLDEHVLMVTAY